MSHPNEHDPGDEAPHTGHYEELSVLGARTGRTVHVQEGEPLPAAPRGFKWRRVTREDSLGVLEPFHHSAQLRDGFASPVHLFYRLAYRQRMKVAGDRETLACM